MTSYPTGQSIRLTAGTITGDSGPEDPDTLDLTIQLPSAGLEVHHIGDLTHVSTGLFHFDYLPPVGISGEFSWEFVATDPDAAARGSFIVDPSLASVAALASDIRAWIRAEVGSRTPPTDFDLAQAYARIGGKAGVALEVWKGRLADFEANPASLAADGLTIGTAANITAIQKHIQRLTILARAEGTYDDGLGSRFLHRPDRREPFARSEEEILMGGRYR